MPESKGLLESSATAKTIVPIKRWLPYWAVLQYDVRQTLRSWVYRTWVLMSVLTAVGYLLNRVGLYRGAGIIQPASLFMGDLLRWTVLGSITLIIVMTVGSIASERGTLADSVLSRGISRYQYFLGKWHARLFTILGTFLAMGLLAWAGSFFFLDEDLKFSGCLVALLTVMALLAVVISWGVAVSAMIHSTVLGIAVLWIVIYGTGFLLAFLPTYLPSPDRTLTLLPHILRGFYDLQSLVRLLGWSALASTVAVVISMVHFTRRDV